MTCRLSASTKTEATFGPKAYHNNGNTLPICLLTSLSVTLSFMEETYLDNVGRMKRHSTEDLKNIPEEDF